MTDPKRYFVRSYGCQMNVYDAERMEELLGDAGMTRAATQDDADVVVLNTCHIREKAAEKVYSEIGRIKKAAAERGWKPVVAVAGCVAQAEGEEIARRAPDVGVIVGPQAYHRLPQMVERAASGQRSVDTDLPTLEKFKALGQRRRAAPSSFLTIQEGCDKFCTYCVVPYTRGAEVSRDADTVLEEAHRLAEAGARELVLLGQNVNAYRDARGTGFADLIRRVADVPGISRIRYTTSHPADMTDELISAHGEIEALMPYLHLPVQSGSDRVLKAMNRSHSAESYVETIEALRRVRPDMAISGDFIVGFPGETDAEFEATLEIVRRTGYAQAYSFKYSPRPGTPAATMGDQIAEEVKTERLARLQALLNEQQLAFNEGTRGVTCDVLAERNGRRPGQLLGKSPWLQSVHFSADGASVGDIVEVRIDTAGPNSLSGLRTDRKAA
ncbi:tRNA (N6-isopentenyl adenosine(37)-C2)-methylthiotransferase MiaB [Pacificimonas flava]|uniref:tRNA-2-methylthio-N(6)-dimethylallyladenosine synthase n=2 Tax=Pacificimonas TaxID=1960290 RepID=A0A219B1B2_9SPHN|nr:MULTISPECIES: tRNA (N6-isopentenyl adenosine(37)-C2)-methylthiotransferase MiaB [Pacificimonas]MBZ6378247.1 tRNA (N6-isopentenyl adenosine(37)-C2)-methylthiotransferase MiaB [Pacificimonas aurantium]OWV32131.1 tRNA (N6-isopentenyl adenosine(37)-C2)-methylthiotransferase MiaB [Pacificimonas flava]